MCCLGKSWQKRQLSDIPDTKEHFINQKSDVLKRSTKVYFLKELVHDCFQKIDLFIMCAFQVNHGRKDSFLIFQIKKNSFQSRKKKFQNFEKIAIFQRGISPWFLSKKRALPWVLFGQIMPQKIVFGYSRYKRSPFRPVK